MCKSVWQRGVRAGAVLGKGVTRLVSRTSGRGQPGKGARAESGSQDDRGSHGSENHAVMSRGVRHLCHSGGQCRGEQGPLSVSLLCSRWHKWPPFCQSQSLFHVDTKRLCANFRSMGGHGFSHGKVSLSA